RVVFVYDPATSPGAYGEAKLEELQTEARRLGITLQQLALRDPDETDRLFTTLPADTNGLLVHNSAINLMAHKRICELAMERRLPAVGSLREFAVERERTPISGMVNRQTAAVEIGDKAAADGLNFHQLRQLREQLERSLPACVRVPRTGPPDRARI